MSGDACTAGRLAKDCHAVRISAKILDFLSDPFECLDLGKTMLGEGRKNTQAYLIQHAQIWGKIISKCSEEA